MHAETPRPLEKPFCKREVFEVAAMHGNTIILFFYIIKTCLRFLQINCLAACPTVNKFSGFRIIKGFFLFPRKTYSFHS